jgi:hypothetical protein
MTQKALKLALEVNESMKDVLKQVNELIAENKALKEALAVDKESLTTEAQPPQRTEPASEDSSVTQKRTWIGKEKNT